MKVFAAPVASPRWSKDFGEMVLGVALSIGICSSLMGPLLAQEPTKEPAKAAPEHPPQNQEPTGPLPVDVEAEQKGLPIRELTVEDAMRIGRINNVGLRTAELTPAEASMDLLSVQAIFQPELYGSTGYRETQSPQRNAFQPAAMQKTLDAQVGWRQRVVTGGLFDLAYQPARYITSGSSAFPDRQYVSAWNLSYTQPLLRGAWTDYNLARIHTSTFLLHESREVFERTVQETLQQIVEAYWELAFARENYRVVAAALAVAREQLRITNERIRVQELAPRDRVADEAEVARRVEDLITAENDIKKREDDLRRLLFNDEHGTMWQQSIRPISVIAIDPKAEELPWQEYADAAILERPDLKALRSDVAAGEQDLLIATRNVLPSVDLVGTYASNGVRDQFYEAFSDSADQQYPDWSLRLQFSIPIGNQAARAARDKGELELERRRRVLYGAMMDVTKEVRDAVRNLYALAQSIHASAVSVRLGENNLETEQVKLRVGASTAFEVQRRNQELREARSRNLRNQLDYRVAESRLHLARGILHEPAK